MGRVLNAIDRPRFYNPLVVCNMMRLDKCATYACFHWFALCIFLLLCLLVGLDMQAILAATKTVSYRGDLAKYAVGRYHALARGIANANKKK